MKYNKLVLTYARSVNNEKFDEATLSLVNKIGELNKNGEVGQFLFWDPSRLRNGSHDPSIPDRLTATLWRDESNMREFIKSTSHKNAVSLKEQGALGEIKIKIIDIDPQDCRASLSLQDILTSNFHQYMSHESLLYEPHNIVDESNITSLLGSI